MRRNKLIEETLPVSAKFTEYERTAFQSKLMDGVCVIGSITDTTPTAKAFTVFSQNDDQLTVTGHLMPTGLKVRVSNSGGALPTGLAAATDYYVILNDANTIQLSTSYAGALAASGIVNISSNGTGTHTITPVALDITARIYASNDNVTYAPVTEAGAYKQLTASGEFCLSFQNVQWDYSKVVYEHTGGRYTLDAESISLNVNTKGF